MKVPHPDRLKFYSFWGTPRSRPCTGCGKSLIPNRNFAKLAPIFISSLIPFLIGVFILPVETNQFNFLEWCYIVFLIMAGVLGVGYVLLMMATFQYQVVDYEAASKSAPPEPPISK